MKDSTSLWRNAVVVMCSATTLWSLAGCAAADADASAEDVTEVASELISDPSGTITIAISQCPAIAASGGVRSTSCGVPAGFVLIGGGGQVEGQPSPGALLQVSKPSGQRWLVQAKDHVHASSYTLRAASIGLKLNGVAQADLQNMVLVSHDVDAPPSHLTTMGVAPPISGNIVLGGGAEVVSTGGQQLLVASRPDVGTGAPTGWIATFKDHEISDPGVARVFVISMPRCPAGFTGGCLATTVVQQTSSTGGGYRPVTMTAVGPVSGVGAKANYTSAGRLLTAIWPTDIAFKGDSTLLVNSKDHDIADSGTTTGFQIILRKQ